MVVNKLAHHLDTLVHFPACTLLGNYEVSKIGNSWKLIHFEMWFLLFHFLCLVCPYLLHDRRVLSEVGGRVGHGLLLAWFESYVLRLVQFFTITRTRETLRYILFIPFRVVVSEIQLSVET